MSIRTTDEFLAKVDAQLIWRRKELTDLRVLVQGSSGNAIPQSMLIRAGIALLYAHWEGFVKTAGTYVFGIRDGTKTCQCATKAKFSRNHTAVQIGHSQ